MVKKACIIQIFYIMTAKIFTYCSSFIMKDIHPKFSKTTVITCSCGNTFTTGSTITDEIKVESCNKCHPFYTGEKRILKTSSIDKFYARKEKTETITK